MLLEEHLLDTGLGGGAWLSAPEVMTVHLLPVETCLQVALREKVEKCGPHLNQHFALNAK